MAIPKKGSRKIIVDGVEYRWLIRRKATYLQTDYGDGKLHVAVELSESQSTLFIFTDHKHPNDIGTKILNPVKPSDVSNWIKQALMIGWTPAVKGKPFLVRVENDVLSKKN